MIMKKFLFIPVILIALSFSGNKEVNAQVLDDVYTREHVPTRKPIPYRFLREADVMWKHRYWRVIDLREKINHPLYYPKTPIGPRRSLIDLLLYGINNEGVTPYTTDNDRFTQIMSSAQIDQKFDAVDQIVDIPDENGNLVQTKIKGEIYSYEVKQYLLKEEWFFDRQHSSMDVRILGMCPIRHYQKGDETSTEGDLAMRKSQVFWIYFPDARRILANNEVFNVNNDAQRLTFDDIFFKRMFNSYIVRESNVFDDRSISDYSLGLQSLLEAEKLKEQIANYEQDLWEY
jgi:gliding motility associated protien GldN